MAEGAKEGDFSFVDKVRLMMYTEQEKEAFLIEKKEKEEKKKAKELEKATGGKNQQNAEAKGFFGKIKAVFVSDSSKEILKEDDPQEASTDLEDRNRALKDKAPGPSE